METETNVVSTKKPSLIGMITSPVEQFNRMKEHNPIFLPFAIVTIATALYVGLGMYLTPVPSELGGMSEMEEFKGILSIITVIFSAIGIMVVYLVSALIYKIAMMIFSNDTKYKVLLSFVLYIAIISILQMIVNGILQVVLQGTATDVYTSLAILAEPGTILHGILSVFDVFSIWIWILQVIGLQIVAGLSKNKAIGLVIFFIVMQTIAGIIMAQIPV